MAPLGLLLPIALWLTFQHKPGWYRPISADDAITQRARLEVANLADSISDALVHRRPFELVLSDHSLNEWLAALPQVWPDVAEQWPRELTQPAVSFQRDRIRLGVHGETRGWRVILGFAFLLSADDGDDAMRLTLSGMQGGSLPIPRFLIRRSLQSAAENHADTAALTAQPDPTRPLELENLLDSPRSVDEWFAGVRVRNRFIWPNGRRPFRIGALSITDGELRARLDPL